MVKTYTFDDVVNALNQVAPYDWRGFWTERLSTTAPALRSAESKAADGNWCTTKLLRIWIAPRGRATQESIDAHYSVGLLVGSDGVVRDTVEGMIAAQSGIGPGMKIVAVNGRRFSPMPGTMRFAPPKPVRRRLN